MRAYRKLDWTELDCTCVGGRFPFVLVLDVEGDGTSNLWNGLSYRIVPFRGRTGRDVKAEISRSGNFDSFTVQMDKRMDGCGLCIDGRRSIIST